jgi:endo-1,4-beta-xylanase
MRVASLVFFLLASFSVALAQEPANSAPPAAAPEWLDPNHDAPTGTLYKSFHSNVISGDVSYLVALPKGYEGGTKRYPVIYWLHPMNGNQRVGATVFLPFFNAAVDSGTLPPAIVVLVNGLGRGMYLNLQKPIENVIIQDLIPHIDQTYRTIARREGRVIQGFSMGGFGAGHLGFKYPNLFGTIVINSGALRDHAWFPFDEHPNALAEKNAAQLRRNTRIFVGCGTKDDLLASNQELHELLQKLGIEHEWITVPEVPHNAFQFYKNLGAKAFDPHRHAFQALTSL